MKAAQITELGSPPVVGEIDDPAGANLEVEAVSLNPLDVAVGAGRFYGGHPPLPYVPGCEAVGRAGGRRVYAFGDGRGVGKDGLLAERAVFPEELLVEIPDDVDAAVAAACGIAGVAGWVPVVWVAQVTAGDRVLVLGASGAVGSFAVRRPSRPARASSAPPAASKPSRASTPPSRWTSSHRPSRTGRRS